MKNFKTLIVVTNHRQLGSLKRTTGFQLAEVTHPLFEFERVEIPVDLMSPLGGLVSIDENSRDLSDPINRDYMERKSFQHKLDHTLNPTQVVTQNYKAVLIAGGFGALWDLVNNKEVNKIIKSIYEAGGVVGALSQGAGCLIDTQLSNGEPLVQGKRMTCMTDSEAKQTGIQDILPISIEQLLRDKGAQIVIKENWSKHLVVDDRLVTGQNTKAAQSVGEAMRQLLVKLNPS